MINAYTDSACQYSEIHLQDLILSPTAVEKMSACAIVPQVAKAEQDKVMLAKVTHDNELRLQQKAQAAHQAKLEEQRQDNTCSDSQ